MKIIFLGPQGSGKSTQAKMLADKLGMPYIEMGRIFRDLSHEDTEEGRLVKSFIENGNLVPDDFAVKILKQKVTEYGSDYVLDGYPRNAAQMEGLEEIDKVFYVKVSDEEAIKRLMLRKRQDDSSQEALETRLKIYHDQTEPLLEQFKTKNILFEINGEQSIEEVGVAILKELEKDNINV